MKIEVKKKDLVLIIIIICVALCAYLSHQLLKETGAGDVIVKVDGEITGTYDLNEDQEISINNGSNLLEIKNGRANMIEADCPDRLCVHQKAISASGENIICLPNKIIVEIKSKTESGFDAVAN
ncbi:MAG: NusG domain II-containing protein [Eubacteriales bacterium]|nr:NusG domain II-containing protein [Eubacteriales bacterium]